MRIGAYASTTEEPTIAIHRPHKFDAAGNPLEPFRLYVEWEVDEGNRAGFLSMDVAAAKDFHATLGEKIAEVEAEMAA